MRRDAGERARFDVIDVGAEREEALEGIGDVAFDLLRRHAGVEGGDDDDGNIDGREEIDRHGDDVDDADDQHHERDHDDEEGIAEGKFWHVSCLRSFCGVGHAAFFMHDVIGRLRLHARRDLLAVLGSERRLAEHDAIILLKPARHFCEKRTLDAKYDRPAAERGSGCRATRTVVLAGVITLHRKQRYGQHVLLMRKLHVRIRRTCPG